MRFITGYWEAHGHHPSYRAMQAGLGLASVSQVYGLFSRLSERGDLYPIAIPRDSDGAPLYFVEIGT
jgi:SOS-response transcriptional repressor LexA